MEVRNQTAETRKKRLSRDDQELILVSVLVVAIAVPYCLVLFLRKGASFDIFFEMLSEPSELWIVVIGLMALFIREACLVAKKIHRICASKLGSEHDNGDATSPDATFSAALENARAGAGDRGNGGYGKLSRAPGSDKLVSARDCLRETDFENAKNLYERLLRSPESSSEAEIALRLIGLYFASENKQSEKMKNEAEGLFDFISSHDSFDAEFVRSFAPWVSNCFVPPGYRSFFSTDSGSDTQKKLATIFRDAIVALISGQTLSDPEEIRLASESAVELDKFCGVFYRGRYGRPAHVNRACYTENELKMNDVYISLGLQAPRAVFENEQQEKRANAAILFIWGAVIIPYLALLVWLMFFG